MFKEYDIVKLKKPLSNNFMGTDVLGTVLIVYDSNPTTYEVEFFNKSGESVGVFTLKDEYLEKVELN